MRRDGMDRLLAIVLLVAAGARFHVGSATGVLSGFTVGGVLALFFIPVWFPALRAYRGARPLMSLGLFAVVAGIVLSVLASPGHAVGRGERLDDIMLMVDVLTGVGVVLWSRQLLPVRQLGLYYGLGMIASAVLQPQAGSGTNPWKFGFAVAVAVAALAPVAGHRRWEILVLAVLALISVTSDSRSYFATFLLAGVLVAWQGRPRVLSRRASWTWTAGLLGALAVGTYYLGSTLLVGGYLGKAAQARSIQQIDASGSLILGGRPELAATIELFKHYPFGFGTGVAPSPTEILVGKSGMANINYDPNNNYVEQFMFGGHFELHSTAGDIWAHFGLVGVALVLLIAFLTLRGLAESVSHRAGSALLMFLSIWTLWNILFSPFLSAAPTLVLALGLGLALKHPPKAKLAPPSEAEDQALPRTRAIA